MQTQEEMNLLVPEKLCEIENQYQIKVLWAAESGSRAWGFASPDSDFDVRFIYKRPQREYLKLEKCRDVIELPVDETWDVSGWDLDKALKLLHNSNPSLYEWMGSPICYRRTGFEERFQPLLKEYFSPRKMLLHYRSIAVRHIRDYLQGETVQPKKYFYALRPILACGWILEHREAPPVLFSELVKEQLPQALYPEVDRLLELKMHGPEKLRIPPIPEIDAYLEQRIRELDALLAQGIPELAPKKEWKPLDDFFLSETD